MCAVGGCLVGVLAGTMVSSRSFAFHRETPFLVNISKLAGGTSLNPAPALGEPSRIAFESVSDLKHNGSTGSQLFFFVLSPNAANPGSLGQVTNFPGESANPASSSQSQLVAFDSAAALFGPPNLARQIFVWYRMTDAFVQLTSGTADSTNPSLDFDGRAVAFQSAADLTGQGTSPGVQILPLQHRR